MVCALSGRQEGIARFVTNVFLRKCSFIGTDIWPVLHPASVTRATLIQRNMDNACKSKGFSTLVISFLLV